MNTEKIIERVQDELKRDIKIDDEVVAQKIRQVLAAEAQIDQLTVDRRKRLYDEIFNTLRRLDILQPLIEDDSISEIMVNGSDRIFIEKNGELQQIPLKFSNAKRLENVIQRIVSSVNRSVNTASPIVDARLYDGSRVNVVLPPIAINGPILTIRKFRKVNYSLRDLTQMNMLDEATANYLMKAVEARKNIFISGGTSSGKTTFLNALSGCIDREQRVISIEDSAELKLDHLPNWVRLETRNANAEGSGQIRIKDLIRTSLRMRPDRIIVGEVRGDETIDMLQAMNTGHSGSLSTGHANSIRDMLKRLETMVYSGKDMPIESIRQQIGSAIDILIHLARSADGSRKLMAVMELVDYSDGQYVLDTVFDRTQQPTGAHQ